MKTRQGEKKRQRGMKRRKERKRENDDMAKTEERKENKNKGGIKIERIFREAVASESCAAERDLVAR